MNKNYKKTTQKNYFKLRDVNWIVKYFSKTSWKPKNISNFMYASIHCNITFSQPTLSQSRYHVHVLFAQGNIDFINEIESKFNLSPFQQDITYDFCIVPSSCQSSVYGQQQPSVNTAYGAPFRAGCVCRYCCHRQSMIHGRLDESRAPAR